MLALQWQLQLSGRSIERIQVQANLIRLQQQTPWRKCTIFWQ